MAFPETIILRVKTQSLDFQLSMLKSLGVWLSNGGFDELFNPAYFEDNDCRYRLHLMGRPVRRIYLNGWHHDNSSTLLSSGTSYKRMHWCLYRRNRNYYLRKWGGLPGNEAYLSPFGRSCN